jgi:hypothetical protein
VSLQVLRDELPTEEWFSIKAIARDWNYMKEIGRLICCSLFLPSFCSVGAMTPVVRTVRRTVSRH